MNKPNLIKKLVHYFEGNAEKLHIELAFLYGSWAVNRQRSDSDIDIAILFSDDVGSEDAVYQTIADISAELGSVFGREINIIRLQWDFDKPMLYYNATIHGLTLYGKNKNLCAAYMSEAISQMEDFCIFGITWQLTAARRNLKGVSNA